MALALEAGNPKVRAEETLLLEQRLPILARVPRMSRQAIRDVLAGKPLPGDVLEAYRTLRASLSWASASGTFPKTILITSAEPAEGKTMTAVNLARTLANGNLRVILVDGDFRRPMVSSFFGVSSHGGTFAELLLGAIRVEDALIPAPGYGARLQLVLASPEHGLLIDLLQTDRVERVLTELREADVIVIDSPPLTEVADALILADAVDAVVVAVRLGHTGRNQLIQLRRMLAQRGISPAGFVVTTRKRSRGSGGGYYGRPPGRLRPGMRSSSSRSPGSEPVPAPEPEPEAAGLVARAAPDGRRRVRRHPPCPAARGAAGAGGRWLRLARWRRGGRSGGCGRARRRPRVHAHHLPQPPGRPRALHALDRARRHPRTRVRRHFRQARRRRAGGRVAHAGGPAP